MDSESVYRKLQRHLDRMYIGFPATKSGVEIRILEHLFTPSEAELALELSAIPESAATIHKRVASRMNLEELTQALDTMGAKGVILRYRPKGEVRYAKLPFAIGMYEYQLPRLTAEFARDARQYFDEEFGQAFYAGKTRQMRVVPINRSIPIERSVSTHDDIRAFVERSEGPFAATPCICRKGEELEGHQCRQTRLEANCLTIGVAARFTIEHGAKELTRAEMLAMLDAADRDALVLQTENTVNPMFICCCCGCCCGVLRGAKHLSEPAAAFNASFHAELDADICEHCGACEERCQMDAISTVDSVPQLDRGRCIGCALCVTTCPSGALHMMANEQPHTPAASTEALYLQILRERYGPWGLAKIAIRKTLGMKI